MLERYVNENIKSKEELDLLKDLIKLYSTRAIEKLIIY